MVEALVRNWWLVLIRGILGLILGIMMFAWPGITIEVLIIFFGAYAFVDGVFAIASAVANKNKETKRWLLVAEGIFGILAGLIAFAWPGITAVALLLLIGAWAFATGIMEIVFVATHWKELHGKALWLLAGIASILFGLLILARPGVGALAVIIFIGMYLIFFGVLLIVLGIWLKTKGKSLPSSVS